MPTSSCKSPSLLSDESPIINDHFSNSSLSWESCVSHPSFLKCNGVTYKQNAFVILVYDVLEPVFGKIHDLLDIENVAYLVCLKFITQYYDEHSHAYVIKQTDVSIYSVHPLKSLPCDFVLHSRRSYDRSISMLILNLTLAHEITCIFLLYIFHYNNDIIKYNMALLL